MTTHKEQYMDEAIDRWIDEDEANRRFVDCVALPPSADEALAQWPELVGSQLLDRPMSGVAGFPGTRLSLYWVMRGKGESHRMAEMLALQRAPRPQTDDSFFCGMGNLLDSCDGDENKLRRLVAAARRNGYEPQTGDVYLANLASKLGDPDGFVSRTRGRAHIRKVIEARGCGCDGAVNVAAREPESDPWVNNTPLGEDIIRKTARLMTKKDPSLKGLPRGELRERIISEHASK